MFEDGIESIKRNWKFLLQMAVVTLIYFASLGFVVFVLVHFFKKYW
jgi:hypothetical protein